jgi:hypothetical protein
MSRSYFCRQCGRRKRAELPPEGWLRVQIAADPELSTRRAAGWGATDDGGIFDGLPCLIAWAVEQAAHQADDPTGQEATQAGRR